MDVKKPITPSMTTGIIPSAPLTRQPTRIARSSWTTWSSIAASDAPASPTVQVAPPPVEAPEL